jgi:hypothetical protein
MDYFKIILKLLFPFVPKFLFFPKPQINIKHMDHWKKERQCIYNVILRRVCLKTVAMEKKKVLDMSTCLYLVIWHANLIFYASNCIVICGLSGCTIFSSTLSHKRHDSGEKFIKLKICVPIFSETFLNP